MTHNREKDAREEKGSVEGRRPYRRPILTEYGSVAKLTQGSGSGVPEGGSGGFMMAG